MKNNIRLGCISIVLLNGTLGGCGGVFPAWKPIAPSDVVATQKTFISDVRASQQRTKELLQLQEQVQISLQQATNARTVVCAARDEEADINGQSIPVVSLRCLLVSPRQQPQSGPSPTAMLDMEDSVRQALRTMKAEVVGKVWVARDKDEWTVTAFVRRTARVESTSEPRQ